MNDGTKSKLGIVGGGMREREWNAERKLLKCVNKSEMEWNGGDVKGKIRKGR